MRKLLHSEFMSKLKDDLAKARKSVIIISPYITSPAVSNLVDAIAGTKTIEKIVVTLPFGIEYLTGAIELDALKRLQKSGVSLRSITNLHSKIYIIDNKIAYLGSANFTGSGWGLVRNSNIEVMTRIQLSKMDTEEIRLTYLNHSNTLELSSELEQAIINGKSFIQSYQQSLAKLNEFVINEVSSLDELKDRYYFFLKNLKDQKKITSFVREKNTKQFGMNVFHISNSAIIAL
ncbi:phospholipase D-like domain-containing protein [Paenibacillus sp. FSL H7-0331]|uniref:phospholipase D-like domain-containing protein n=1 Tax=Paenibacillus sp. FSL H7-0331 TaxID=1920421 RepID=UPI00096F2A08|nr:phospholipase D-like domain-containing protein [Paenibacillus sp. FSL H7-0331]OMF07318.1 hypothetical protein BK127_29990 [Paenibacillus sp. FSL H7-0331]